MALGSLPPLQVGAKPIEDIVRYVNKYLRAPQGGQQAIQNITIFGGIVAGSLKFFPDNSVDVGQLSPVPLRPRNVYAATAFVGPVLDTGAGGGNLTLKRAGSAVATFAAALATFATAVTISGATTLAALTTSGPVLFSATGTNPFIVAGDAWFQSAGNFEVDADQVSFIGASNFDVQMPVTLEDTLDVSGLATFETGAAFGTLPATTGAVRLSYGQSVLARNSDNSADLTLLSIQTGVAVNALSFGGIGVGDIQLRQNDGTKWFFSGSLPYDLLPWDNTPSNDNRQSLGSSTSRLKNGWFGTALFSPLLDSQSGDLVLRRAGAAAATFGSSAVTINQPITSGTWQATAIDATHGGTNQTTWTTGDTLYASAANSLSKLTGNIASTKMYLSQTGTGSVSAAPAWAQVAFADLAGIIASAQVSGAYPNITGVGTLASGAVPASLVTAGTFGTGDYTFPANLTVTTEGYFGSTLSALAPYVESGDTLWATSRFGIVRVAAAATMKFLRVNGSFASPTQILQNQGLGSFSFRGYNADTGTAPGTATVNAFSRSLWTLTSAETALTFATTPAGALAPTTWWELEGAGAFRPSTTKVNDVGSRTFAVRAMYAGRFYALGTALTTTDFAVSSGWGTSPTKAITGTDMGGRISVTANATTSANPTVTLTFHDGTFTNVPAIVYNGGDTTTPSVGAWLMTAVSATSATFTWIGTPTATHVYVLDWVVMPN